MRNGHLVLSAKPYERICMTLPDGREVWLTILHTEATKCRIGFEAPADVTIDREKVHYARQTHGEAVQVDPQRDTPCEERAG